MLRNEVGFPETIPISSFGKSLIRKLLIKDEHKRLGSQSGASEVKQHKWFSTISWGLLRNSTPPIIPADSNGADAINFRNVKESRSLNLDHQGDGKSIERNGTGNGTGGSSSGNKSKSGAQSQSNGGGQQAHHSQHAASSSGGGVPGSGPGRSKPAEVKAAAGKHGIRDEDGDAVESNPFSGFSSMTLQHDDD